MGMCELMEGKEGNGRGTAANDAMELRGRRGASGEDGAPAEASMGVGNLPRCLRTAYSGLREAPRSECNHLA
jgi:hypothetical protein